MAYQFRPENVLGHDETQYDAIAHNLVQYLKDGGTEAVKTLENFMLRLDSEWAKQGEQ